MKRKLIAAVSVAGMMVGVAACGNGGDDKAKTDAGGAKEITVWVMDGSAPKAWIDEVNKEFSAKHPGVTVKVEEQKWTGIQEKVTTALSENNPPDVLELGNTQTAYYAVTGGLADLTKDKAKLGADAWQKSMLASAEIDGKLYSAPWYAANRVVIYDKKAYEKAGCHPAEDPRRVDRRSGEAEGGRPGLAADLPARPELVRPRWLRLGRGRRPRRQGRRQVEGRTGHPAGRFRRGVLQEAPVLLHRPQGQGRGQPAAVHRHRPQGRRRLLDRSRLGGRMVPRRP